MRVVISLEKPLHFISTFAIPLLQQRIHQKDETIAKYQSLLKEARQELQQTHKRHEQELKIMQNKLHTKTDESFHKFKSAVQDTLTKPPGGTIPTNDQVRAIDFSGIGI